MAPLERAIALRKESQAAPEDLAMDRFYLANALWDSGSDKRRARQLANEALALFTPLKLDENSGLSALAVGAADLPLR